MATAVAAAGGKDTGGNATWQKWHDEYERAGKAKGYDTWQTRAKKIIRRYRDERVSADADTQDGRSTEGSKFNILWSNIQTLKPALFAKSPKPVVERRYLDKDDVGRTASTILERALLYELDDGNYQASIGRAVLDRLLPGRGVVWVRYEPRFTPVPSKTQENAEEAERADTADEGETPAAEQQEEVASESVPVDYIDWQDFRTSVSRTWEEVWWVDKRVYMTRRELVARFGAEKGKQVTLDWSPVQQEQQPGTSTADPTDDDTKRATIHETWDKRDRKVYWWADKWSNDILDVKPDPLRLEGFFPCPRPLFATTTNETLIPIPDYYEYQDQAVELDDLTARISALTKTIKACGVYDASVTELKRMFEEGFENQLVPADNMAEFMQKAGNSGMGHIWLMPVRDLALTLMELYKAREQVKQTLYEITGLSDIIRGQAEGPQSTATEQRIKGQFASMRLNDMQAEVARFCRDTLCIMGEIIAEHFDPMTLFLVSGFEQYAKEQWPPQQPQPVPAGPPGMGHNGGPPLQGAVPAPAPVGAPGPVASTPAPAGMLPLGGGIPLGPTPEQVAQMKAAAMFKSAIELLRNEKLRGFRIEIETDSLIEPDQRAMQQSRSELMGAISQFLPQAMEAGAQAPELRPLMARLLMFFLRGFKASRDIESAFEQFIDDMQKQAQNPKPKPPTPEEIKAQAEMQKQQAESQRAALDFQREQQKAAMELQMAEREHAMKLELMQAEMAQKAQELELKREELAMKEREMLIGAQMTQRQAEIDAQAAEHKAALDHEAMTTKHELGLEAAEAKAAQARSAARNGA